MKKTPQSKIVIKNPGSNKFKGRHAVKKEETNFYKSHGLNYKIVILIVWNLYYEELYWLDVFKLSKKDNSLSFGKGKGHCHSQFFAGR